MSDISPLPLLYMTDASRDYKPELVERCGGKIFDVYLFDANLLVSCCSLIPSYEMEYIESVPLCGPEEPQYRDELEDDLIGANIESNTVYFDVTGWLKEHTKDGAEYPETWDCKTSPFLLRVYSSRHDVINAADWATCLDDHDGDYRAAHNSYMDDVREDINGNSRY